jgi:hypothetical protein
MDPSNFPYPHYMNKIVSMAMPLTQYYVTRAQTESVVTNDEK